MRVNNKISRGVELLRKSLVVVGLLIMTTNLYSQESVKVPIELGSEWESFYEDELIILHSSVKECPDPAGGPVAKYALVAVENKTEESVMVSWHYDIYNKNECLTCSDPDFEYAFRYLLEPGQHILPDCESMRITIDDGAKVVFLGTFLSHVEKNSVSDIVNIELTNLITNTLK